MLLGRLADGGQQLLPTRVDSVKYYHARNHVPDGLGRSHRGPAVLAGHTGAAAPTTSRDVIVLLLKRDWLPPNYDQPTNRLAQGLKLRHITTAVAKVH